MGVTPSTFTMCLAHGIGIHAPRALFMRLGHDFFHTLMRLAHW